MNFLQPVIEHIPDRCNPEAANVLLTEASQSTNGAKMVAYFEFEQTAPNGDLKRFIFKLTEDQKIREARAILAQGGNKNHVQGTIIQQRAPYNPEWSFHLRPESIGFFELQIEVCDANVTYVEDHLDEIGGSTLPRSFWCPWSSKLSAEVTASIDPVTEKPTGP